MTAVTGVDSQRAPVASALARTIGVKVTDQRSAPIAGFGVGWAVTTGAGSVSTNVSATDGSGVAFASWTLGPTVGTQTLTATLPTGVSVVFTAIAQAAGLSSLAVVSDPFVSVTAGTSTTALQVRALDRYGNSIAGLAHTWSTTGGTLSAATAVTGANGVGSVVLATDPTPRQYTVTARFPGGYDATIIVRGN